MPRASCIILHEDAVEAGAPSAALMHLELPPASLEQSRDGQTPAASSPDCNLLGMSFTPAHGGYLRGRLLKRDLKSEVWTSEGFHSSQRKSLQQSRAQSKASHLGQQRGSGQRDTLRKELQAPLPGTAALSPRCHLYLAPAAGPVPPVPAALRAVGAATGNARPRLWHGPSRSCLSSGAFCPGFSRECRSAARRAAPALARSLQMVLPTSFSPIPNFPSAPGKTPVRASTAPSQPGAHSRASCPQPFWHGHPSLQHPVPGVRLRCSRVTERVFEKLFHRGTIAATHQINDPGACRHCPHPAEIHPTRAQRDSEGSHPALTLWPLSIHPSSQKLGQHK